MEASDKFAWRICCLKSGDSTLCLSEYNASLAMEDDDLRVTIIKWDGFDNYIIPYGISDESEWNVDGFVD